MFEPGIPKFSATSFTPAFNKILANILFYLKGATKNFVVNLVIIHVKEQISSNVNKGVDAGEKDCCMLAESFIYCYKFSARIL